MIYNAKEHKVYCLTVEKSLGVKSSYIVIWDMLRMKMPRTSIKKYMIF